MSRKKYGIEPKSEEVKVEEAEVKTEVKVEPGYYLTDAVSCKGGVKSAGKKVTADDFAGGEDTIKTLIDRKLIVKK